MRIALVNPPWSFDGSIYFGCKEPHLPLEYGYSRALLAEDGHDAQIFDAQLRGLTLDALHAEVADFAPAMTVVTTAPSYLFWRCAPPELRVPRETVRALRDVAGHLVGVGPHASTTPRTALRKLDVDAVVIGECEEGLARLARTPRAEWRGLASLCVKEGDEVHVQGPPDAVEMKRLPALRWDPDALALHRHHHHRFDGPPIGPGAELEASRGCPYHCTFCAKDNFRDTFRKRPLETLLAELDGLIKDGVKYVYFIDEIFVPDRALLEALVPRDIVFGVQMRIDNWTPAMLDLLGRAGCVSIEAGVESITPEGRDLLAKKCRLSTAQLTTLLVRVKESVPFVQANLLGGTDDPKDVAAWRAHLKENGVWSNDPVPLFPYPGSPDYTRRWGAPDDDAWERAHEHYLQQFAAFSDLQESRPVPLAILDGNPATLPERGPHLTVLR